MITFRPTIKCDICLEQLELIVILKIDHGGIRNRYAKLELVVDALSIIPNSCLRQEGDMFGVNILFWEQPYFETRGPHNL